jgi:hypothetical protein
MGDARVVVYQGAPRPPQMAQDARSLARSSAGGWPPRPVPRPLGGLSAAVGESGGMTNALAVIPQGVSLVEREPQVAAWVDDGTCQAQ